MIRPFDPDSARFTGEAFPVPGAEGVSAVGGLFHSGVSASTDGAILFGGGIPRRRLNWFNREGKIVGSVGQPDRFVSVRISPDATMAALTISDSSGIIDLSTIDFARGVQTRLTAGNAAMGAIWSPDSRRLIYFPVRMDSILERNASGAGQQDTILQSPNAVAADDVSPDRRYLLYDEMINGHYNLRILPRAPIEAIARDAAGKKQPVAYLRTTSDQRNAQFSPDGKWIVYTSNESGRPEIYVQSFPAANEAKWQVSDGGGSYARWRRDGKELFYWRHDGNLMAASIRVAGQGLEFGTPVPLFRIAEPIGGHGFPYDVAPGGQRILAINPAGEDNSSTLKILINWQAGLER